MAPTPTDIRKWIRENEQYFSPPVCNKMLHQEGQMKVFFVGGPNQRQDFHIEKGEEFFFMLEGDMVLRVLERGNFKDVTIKQGQCFLLPGKIPHSPQRQEKTVGLVVERERAQDEKDCLRFYVPDGTDPLFERWFHCQDLGTQVAPVIREFFSSQEYKTGKPQEGSVPRVRPFEEDKERILDSPFSLEDWLAEHQTQIRQKGKLNLFGHKYKFQVVMYGPGEHKGLSEVAETLFWQWEGESSVCSGGVKEELSKEFMALVPRAESWTLTNKGFTIMIVSSP